MNPGRGRGPGSIGGAPSGWPPLEAADRHWAVIHGWDSPRESVDSGSARDVRHPAPGGLGRQLDRLAVPVGLDVLEGLRLGLEGDVELALLDALVQPGRAEEEPAQPVHQQSVGRADQLGPAVVDVLVEADDDGAELQRRLFAALAEVALVEREAQLAVFEDEVLSGVVVAAACRIHDIGPRRGALTPARSSAS